MDRLDHNVRLRRTVLFNRFLLANMHKPRNQRMHTVSYCLMKLPNSNKVILVQDTEEETADWNLVNEICQNISNKCPRDIPAGSLLTIFMNFTSRYLGSEALRSLVNQHKFRLDVIVASPYQCYRKSCNECSLAFNAESQVLVKNTMALKDLMALDGVNVRAFSLHDWCRLVHLIKECDTLTGLVEEYSEQKYNERFSPDKDVVHGKPAVRKDEDIRVVKDLEFIRSTKRQDLRDQIRSLEDGESIISAGGVECSRIPSTGRPVRKNLEPEFQLIDSRNTTQRQDILDMFINSGLHGADWPRIAFCVLRLPLTGQVCILENDNQEHVEDKLMKLLAADDIDVWETEEETPLTLVVYTNISSCYKCVEKLITFTQKYKLHLEIVAAAPYDCKRESCWTCYVAARYRSNGALFNNTEALRELVNADIKLRGFQWNDWSNLVALINEAPNVTGSAKYTFDMYAVKRYGVGHPKSKPKSLTRYEEDECVKKDFEFYTKQT